ncbi:hypothetical protein DRI50_07450 [candidate division KSB1 bacterium]|nr:MAG: hypothetical protein DRI50_07450 [candidate division KSB1 bacterium]
MLEKIIQAGELYIYLALFLFVLLITWMTSALFSKAKADQAAAGKSKGGRLSYLGGLLIVLVLAVVLLIMSLTRAYTAFTAHELIASVECRAAYGFGRDAFELIYTPMVDGRPGEEQSFILKGEQWSIGGDILEWQSYMNFIGLKSMYRLTRLQGRYVEAEDEMTKEVTAFPLVEPEQSEFWRMLYDLAVKIPFIKSAHQNFVSTYPYFGDSFAVYATPSGFTLERLESR